MSRSIYILGKDSIPGHMAVSGGRSREIVLVALPGTSTGVHMRLDITGPGADVRLSALYLSSADDRIDLDITVRHLCGGSRSRQLLKGIVGGRAKVAFNGLIYVQKDAQRTEAYQENHSILLSDTALVETRPQLEIYADDVKCSHGATVGSLNQDELFYMRSRGIPEDEARSLQMISFVSPILSLIPEGELRGAVLDALVSL